MADGISDKVKALIDSVRGKLTSTPSGRPLDRRLDGYRMYKDEQNAMGDPVEPYESWIKSQPVKLGDGG